MREMGYTVGTKILDLQSSILFFQVWAPTAMLRDVVIDLGSCKIGTAEAPQEEEIGHIGFHHASYI